MICKPNVHVEKHYHLADELLSLAMLSRPHSDLEGGRESMDITREVG